MNTTVHFDRDDLLAIMSAILAKSSGNLEGDDLLDAVESADAILSFIRSGRFQDSKRKK